ncbi:MAG: hypothetical protein ACRCYU_14170, partial [Nocardioides sp.]
TVTSPTGPGWALLDNVVAGDMRTVVWTKSVTAGDAPTVAVPLSGTAKHTTTLAAYTGVADAQPVFAAAADTANHSSRLAPAVTVPDGAWVVSYWADKSSTTTTWTAGGAATARSSACAESTGRVCSLLADSGNPVPTGAYPGISASTNVASSKATTWSIVLAPIG